MHRARMLFQWNVGIDNCEDERGHLFLEWAWGRISHVMAQQQMLVCTALRISSEEECIGFVEEAADNAGTHENVSVYAFIPNCMSRLTS